MSNSPSKWQIIYYTALSGDSPPKDFIEGLDKKALAKVYFTFELLEEFGIRLGKPHVEKLTGTDLWELRILYVAVTVYAFCMLL